MSAEAGLGVIRTRVQAWASLDLSKTMPSFISVAPVDRAALFSQVHGMKEFSVATIASNGAPGGAAGALKVIDARDG